MSGDWFSRLALAACCACVVLLAVAPGWAAGTDIRLSVAATIEGVNVRIDNRGTKATQDLAVRVELAGKHYEAEPVATLAPGETVKLALPTTAPDKAGSHPLITRLGYSAGETRMSALNVIYVDHGAPFRIAARPRVRSIRMHQRGSITVRYDKAYAMRLVLPEEVAVTASEELDDGKRFWLDNPYPRQALHYAIYAIVEADEADQHGTRIVRARLQSAEVDKEWSRFPPWLIALLGAIGLVASWLAYRSRGDESEARVAFIRYAFSVFTVSLLVFLYRTLYVVPDWLLTHIETGRGWAWFTFTTLANWLYFEGGDYDLFSRRVLDQLYLYMLVGNYFVLRYLIKPKPETDKYWHLLRAVFSRQWSKLAKVALLTLFVKIFYVPLVCSWTISNVEHQQRLWATLSWDWLQIHAFIVAALILVDVAIFTVGYLVELPQLDNQIRSVEPTLLGWVVCLGCYPPFNRFSLAPFNQPLPIEWPTAQGFLYFFALSLIAIMWALYCWATVALGTRASNLTNRGIVDSGPYAYVRHPAYAAKCFLWLLGGLFLGERGLVMVLGLMFVYALRAWTEERHLSQDPDYLAYKEKVPYRMIPWLI
jgi:protein-S-isoprenylcysteine O-methyltransferase Ste14